MAGITVRLDRLRPTIERLMSIAGTPGVSIGVTIKDKPAYFASYGYRDVDQKLPITKDTIFPLCSLTKAFTAAALGLLVDDGKLSWDSLIKDVLPSFQSTDPILHNHTTITDILCHRTGMSWGDNLILGTDGNVLLKSEDVMKYINSRQLISPFRARFDYNNLHYELAGKIIEHVSGQSYSSFVQSRLLKPLGLDRTWFQTPSHDVKDVSVCYNTLDDCSVAPINCPRMGDDSYGAASGGARSSINDLVRLYGSYMEGFINEFADGTSAPKISTFKQLNHIMSAKIPFDHASQLEATYAFGWGRVQLPGRLGQIGINPGLLPKGMPIVGKGTSKLVLFHQGSLPGSLTFVALLPEIETVIIVLTNSLALNDTADWIGQLIIEELLEVSSDMKNDFVTLAEETVTENLKWYNWVQGELEKGQKSGTSPRPLEEYAGTYWDDLHVFRIDVTLNHDKLYWFIEGLESEKFSLKHYQDNTFTWLQPRNELSKRGRWVGSDQNAAFWKVEFGANDSDRIDKLVWAHDGGVPPVAYKKI